ncbi:hypothetical protein [Eubacterium ventriosum]|uniref:hypothetical protein n=1 Tax=Eubacterium ventriosum TaxID=39496 RepID=UPI003993B533
MPEKKLIEVTVEKRLRVCKEIEATEEEIEFLRRGENPFESEFRIISGNPRQFNYRDESANCAYLHS